MTVGSDQCWRNVIQYVWERYYNVDLVNINDSAMDNVVVGGIGGAIDYNSLQTAGILCINLERCILDPALMDGRPIYLQGMLYSPGSCKVDVNMFILYEKQVSVTATGTVNNLQG